jgi:putative ABC transport system permease protein
MQELFGLSMNTIAAALLVVFLGSMAAVAVLGWRNRVMVKLGLRNIPRRKTQTVLIVVGVMLSTVITSAAFGTGDTLSFSVRNEVLLSLGATDEAIFTTRAGADDNFGSDPYIPYERFEQLQRELADWESVDGLTPLIAESAPTVNLRTSLSEGRMAVHGLEPGLLQGFGVFTLTSGEEIRLEELAEDEAYINDRAAEELDAEAGDELRLFVADRFVALTVKGVIDRGGLAGSDPTVILPLGRAQDIFDKPGQINLIFVSNRGDDVAGADLSEEVTRELRVLFADEEVASRLQDLLNQEVVHKALEEEERSLSEPLQEKVSQLRNELQREVHRGRRFGDERELTGELISLLADDQVSSVILKVLDQGELNEVAPEAIILFDRLAELEVADVKRRVLDQADLLGSVTTTFFLGMSMFSIAVGILLIFLIFVMLAAARRSEMGMARAVGARRGHLVQMFVFEGAAYSLASAAVGVLLGLAVSALMVSIINRLIAGSGEDFRITSHFELRTVIVSYCLGMVITFSTVTVSAYRVSRLNIVAAIRDLPTPIAVSTTAWREILGAPWQAFLLPFRLTWGSGVALVTMHPQRALTRLLQALWAVASIPPAVIRSIFRMLARFFIQGWLAFLLGLAIAVQDIRVWERISWFGGGVSLMVLGLGLMLRTGLRRTSMRASDRDRIAFTFMGVAILVFWAMPMDFFEGITGELQGDFDVMFVAGIFMVMAAVWVVMYNADLLVRALTFFTGRFGKLRPVLVTAVAYPMSAKFRTGLTLAMFSLVIFALVVTSVLTEIFSSQFADPESVTGGWDIEGKVNFNTPIEDIRGGIDEKPDLRAGDFEAIGGFTLVGIQARQVGSANQRWEDTRIRAADDDFLRAARYEFKLIAEGYGTTGEEVWQALLDDPSLAVVGGDDVQTAEGRDEDRRSSYLKGVYYQDDEMSAVDIEVREPRTDTIVHLKVIGVMDRIHQDWGVLTSKANLDDAIPFPVPITTYRFRLVEGADAKQVTQRLESSFLEHGMEAVALEEELREEAAATTAFARLFTGFMGLGLLVGIAALGVVSTRAVVERRQQIGVMRAIGYRRRMIQLSFMLEFSFIALLGIAIGVSLGLILGYNAVRDIRQDAGIDTIRFTVPWIQIGVILVVTYLFSLLATFVPARQASRIYPAEALRYE